jgi:hypothetical protein
VQPWVRCTSQFITEFWDKVIIWMKSILKTK